MNIRHISAVATLAIFLPFAASALTVEEIQLQISNLLSQITQLQQQLTQTQAQTQIACTADAKICPDGSAVGRSGPNCEFAACPGATTPPATACPVFTRTLYRGISGTDVASLQASLGVSQTGYYGPMTEAAVQQMQVQEGIVSSGTAATTGYGAVGPKTRTAFLRRCGVSSQNFTASPTYGTAPLNVTFKWIPGSVSAGDQYSVEFGDGQTGTFSAGYPCSDNLCSSHTYTSNGTYTAKLLRANPLADCMPGRVCGDLMGTVTITVGGTTSSGAPTISGLDAPTSLSVGQTGTWTVRATAPAGTQLSYSVQWGDEMTYPLPMSSSAMGIVNVSGTFTHSYAQAGTYKPVFTVSNSSGSAQTSASIVVGGSTSGVSFSAYPTSGTAPLAVSFSASNLSPSSSYSINFGDGTTGSTWISSVSSSLCAQGTNCNGTTVGPSVMSHTYTSAGTYTAQLIANSCPPGAYCFVGPLVVGTVTITARASETSASSLYGTVTRVAGNCMPTVVMPGYPSSSSCTRGPVSREIYVYPEIRTTDYMPNSTDVGDIYSYLIPGYALTSPIFGTPFTIDFYSITDAIDSVLYFGDGSRTSCGIENGGRGSTCRVTHTYTNSGRYTVELRDATGKVLQRLPIYLPQGGIAPVARTQSDVNGSYRVNVPPGTYSVYTQDDTAVVSGGGGSVTVRNEPVLHDILINDAAY